MPPAARCYGSLSHAGTRGRRGLSYREGALQRVAVHVTTVGGDKRQQALQAVGVEDALGLSAAQQLENLDALHLLGLGFSFLSQTPRLDSDRVSGF